MRFLDEFKAFAIRGNVLDLAVAVVIGGAFGKIISALVEGIIMPVIGLLLGGIDISGKTLTVGHAVVKWGLFLQSIIDFTIISFAIFTLVKIINSLQHNQTIKEATPPPDVVLLGEIRDLLQDEAQLRKNKSS